MNMTDCRTAVLRLSIVALGLVCGDLQAAGRAPRPYICERACWGARPPQHEIPAMAELNRVVIHHSAGPYDYLWTGPEQAKELIRTIQGWQMDTQGMADIGYHFLIDKLGHIYEGRAGSIDRLPQGPNALENRNSFSVAFIGLFHEPNFDPPTTEALAAMADLIAWRMPDGWAGPFGSPDCDFGNQGVCVGYVDSGRRVRATVSPGDLYHPYIGDDTSAGALRHMIQLRMNGPGSLLKDSQWVTVRSGPAGWQVMSWNYDVSQGQISPWQARWGRVPSQLVPVHWTGLFLYDYETGRFSEAVYSTKSPL